MTKLCHDIPISWANRKLWIMGISGTWWSNLSNPGKLCQLPPVSVTPVSTLCCPLEAFVVRFASNPDRADGNLKAFFKYGKDNINLLCQISHKAALTFWSVRDWIPALCKSKRRNNQYGNFTRVYCQIQGCRNEIAECLNVELECHKLPVFFTKKNLLCCLKDLNNPIHIKIIYRKKQEKMQHKYKHILL